MQTMSIAAGVIALITGVVHSALGEMLIFRKLRNGGLVPTTSAPPLGERNVRMI